MHEEGYWFLAVANVAFKPQEYPKSILGEIPHASSLQGKRSAMIASACEERKASYTKISITIEWARCSTRTRNTGNGSGMIVYRHAGIYG